ncbi:FecR family protein, partial [Sinomicrobium sp. M5D2P17]
DTVMDKITDDILELIAAYTTGEIGADEFRTLTSWIEESEENRRAFKSYLYAYKTWQKAGFEDNLDKGASWDRLISRLEKPFEPVQVHKQPVDHPGKPRFISRYIKYAAVAVILLLLSIGFIFKESIFNGSSVKDTEMVTPITSGGNKAVLTLEDGEDIVLEEGRPYTTGKAKSNGKRLVYREGASVSEAETVYNYLTVPRGGQFYVQLSDSTGIWLNSETRIKYPVSFAEGRPREVELVYGEAYFEVSPAARHDDTPFRVHTREQVVEVLGTEFNIKGYREEGRVLTTLVAGKVSVSNGALTRTIFPGQQSVVEDGKETLEVTAANVTNEIAWKHGEFRFEDMRLEAMLRILSRWYDLEVKFDDAGKRDMIFSGVLKRSESVTVLLEKIERVGGVSFQIKDGTLIIK